MFAARFCPAAAAGRPRGQEQDANRRGEPRTSGPRVRSIAARVRGSHAIAVIDLSASGACIEGARPLRPGARIDVHLAFGNRPVVLAARVVRCLVAAIDANQGITYQAGLSFEQRFDWLCEEKTLSGSPLHNECSS